jgi:hypothetical protein
MVTKEDIPTIYENLASYIANSKHFAAYAATAGSLNKDFKELSDVLFALYALAQMEEKHFSKELIAKNINNSLDKFPKVLLKNTTFEDSL